MFPAKLFLPALLITCICAGGCGRKEKSGTTKSGPVEKPQDRLEWNLATLVEAYEKVGRRNEAWNRPATQALDLFARVRAGDVTNDYTAEMEAALTQAVAAGCDDPMVLYLHCRFVLGPSNPGADAMLAAYKSASDGLVEAGYPPIRRFYGVLRTAESMVEDRPWRVTQNYLRGAGTWLQQALEEKTMPWAEVDDAASEYLLGYRRVGLKTGRASTNIQEVLFRNWSHLATPWRLKGDSSIQFAWDARGSGYADSVTEEGWERFREHLAVAQASMERAWELDPTDHRAPTRMLTVAMGRGLDRAEMETWFDRAMTLAPNNYDACTAKLMYLEPKWHGSVEEMVEFGWQCMTNSDWSGTVPLLLVDVHEALARYLPKETRTDYWKNKAVWPDIRASYDRFLQVNPDATGYYHNYFRYAYLCEQWFAMARLLPRLGEINYQYFGGKPEFDKMVAAMQKQTNVK